MSAIYRNLLRLYPREFRREFGAEMAAVFGELEAQSAEQSRGDRFRFMVFEAVGLMRGLIEEHWRQFGMRRFTMRGDFRFPKMTWVLMLIILAGVLVTINKGEAISVSVAPMAEPVGAIHPASTVMSNWTINFLLMYVVGVVVGGALFLVRQKTGKHAAE